MNPSPLNLDNNLYTQDNLLHQSTPFINVEYYFHKIYLFLHGVTGGGSGNSTYDASTGITTNDAINFHVFLNVFKNILYFLLIFFVTVTIYTIVRLFEIRKKEHEHLHHEIAEYAHHQKEHKEKKESAVNGKPKNERWESILKHLYSETSADWKLAIIDADEMLLQVMTDLGFKGDGLGEKLKNADRDDFHSLSAAWEVHTIRNRIAHEGIAYELSAREAKRVIALYEQIFHEFGYV